MPSRSAETDMAKLVKRTVVEASEVDEFDDVVRPPHPFTVTSGRRRATGAATPASSSVWIAGVTGL